MNELQSKLVEAEKASSLGSLVAGVAHEINTPIGIGVTSITFLEEQLQRIEKLYFSGAVKKSDLEHFISSGKEAVASTLNNLRRAAELIRSFKQVAVDQTSGEKRSFNVKEYIDEILLSLKPKYKRTDHKVEVTGKDDMVVTNFPGALMQVITNLVMNSLLHGFEDVATGTILISVDAQGTDAVILYTDDGCGMNAEVKEKIFNPFFTTKKGEGGSGLGMHIVDKLVTGRMEGSIECESSPGKGVRFKIIIPDIEDDHAA
jgi:signal transduction histidine kinase